MSVPTGTPGNAEAATVAEESNQRTETIGDGYIMGNLVADPEMRFTPNGRAVCRTRLAYTPRIRNDDGNGWHDGPAEFYDVIVWGGQAERTAEHLQRGDRVVVAGTWTKRKWTDREDNERETIELTARDIGPSLLFHAARVERKAVKSGQAAKAGE